MMVSLYTLMVNLYTLMVNLYTLMVSLGTLIVLHHTLGVNIMPNRCITILIQLPIIVSEV